MKRHFDEELKDLHRLILQMSAVTLKAIAKSIDALTAHDLAKAQQVIDEDDRVDEMELVIDEKGIDLIARHQPMAGDLRYIATGMKLNAELERIADLAVDVAQRVLDLAGKPALKPLVDIPRLSQVAQTMVRDAIESFVNRDAELARKVVLADSEADELRNSIQQELVTDYMQRDASTAPRAVPLLLVARHLERICDHATNIAEDVIFMVQAKVVKHHPEMLNEQ